MAQSADQSEVSAAFQFRLIGYIGGNPVESPRWYSKLNGLPADHLAEGIVVDIAQDIAQKGSIEAGLLETGSIETG